jgi:hypothetical protein
MTDMMLAMNTGAKNSWSMATLASTPVSERALTTAAWAGVMAGE